MCIWPPKKRSSWLWPAAVSHLQHFEKKQISYKGATIQQFCRHGFRLWTYCRFHRDRLRVFPTPGQTCDAFAGGFLCFCPRLRRDGFSLRGTLFEYLGTPRLDPFGLFYPVVWRFDGLAGVPPDVRSGQNSAVVRAGCPLPSIARYADQWRAWLRPGLAFFCGAHIFPFAAHPGLAPWCGGIF